LSDGKNDFVIKPNILRALSTKLETMKEFIDRSFLIDGIVMEKTHVVIYGPSGAGKSTILSYLCKEALNVSPSLDIHYMAVDGAEEITYNTARWIDNERFIPYTDVKPSLLLGLMQEQIAGKHDLNNTLYIFDTLKKFQNNVIGKSENVSHFETIRQLTKLGATCISISHTNKDGSDYSGTAELEQDSDAIFRIDGITSMSNKEMMTSSIKPAGRVRWKNPGERSFSFPIASKPDQVKEIKYVDVERWRHEKEDMYLIEPIIDIIKERQGLSQKDIYIKVKEITGDGYKTIAKTLHAYNGRHWHYAKNGSSYKYRTPLEIVYE